MRFREFLPEWTQLNGIGTEDILSCFLPLVQETLQAHQRGTVAPLHDIALIQVTSQRLWFEEHLCTAPTSAASKLQRIEAQRRRGWNIVSESSREVDLNTGAQSVQLLNVVDQFDASTDDGPDTCDLTVVRYVTGYGCWEQSLGHHDPLTDIFSLGMILASLALQLDFHDEGELQRFVVDRENLFRIKPNLHPVLAQVIRQTTELHRDARPQELTGVLLSLENYRDQIISIETQLALDQILNASAQLTPTQRLLLKLRDRLFDLSRRNPLLNFRNTSQALNLTQASVPIAININNIRADQLIVWDESLQTALAKGQPIRLNQRINLNEAVYASSVLERLIADARRDRNEYGCSQLRLVVAFLSWSNLKEKPIQAYVSPLVLVPVEINKQKGIKDTFTFEGTSTTAEVNPVIRHLFRELYNISLPESIELEGAALDQLFELLRTQINASEPAITLHKVDRPRIDLIHEKAKRRLDQYRRSSRVAGRGAARFEDIEYSYDAINYHPLGVRLFSQRVKQPEFHLQRLMSTGRIPRSYAVPSNAEPDKNDHPTVTVERDVAVIRDAAHDDPYQWSFDLCSLTLANLHYRRMSLVRDYEAIAQQALSNPAFEAAFQTAVKSDDELSLKREPLQPIAMPDRFEVVISDPTQSKAIAQSRTGASYIIQGPPGTGKSQTITNLIADFVAQGKRVLFVCEKRAAIDVVYARLSQCGLGSLCSLVHDSQTDKKEFIQDLQSTYQAFTGHDGKSKISSQRQQIVKQLTGALDGLARYEAAMQTTIKAHDDSQSISMRELLDQLIGSPHKAHSSPRAATQSPSAIATEPPTLPQWWSAGDRLPTLQLRLQHLNAERIFNAHPLHALRGNLVSQENAPSSIMALAQRSLEQLAQVTSQLDSSQFTGDPQWTIAQIQHLLQHAQSLQPLSNDANLALLDPKSPRSALFLASLGRISDVKIELAAAHQRTRHWRKKLPPDDTRTALAQARQWQSSLWRWLLPGYWRLRKILNESYDFAAHQLRPSWSQVLEDLLAEHDTQTRLEQVSQSIRREMSLQLDPVAADELVKRLERDLPKEPEWLRWAHQQLLQSPTANDSIALLVRMQPSLDALRETSDRLLAQWQSLSLGQLQDQLTQIMAHLPALSSVADLIQLVDALPREVAAFVRTEPLTFEQMEARVTQHAWQRWLDSQPDIERFHASEQTTHIEQVEKILPKWLSLNAQEICERARERFLQNSQPNPKNPALSKRYQQGRKVLEHEFGKTMRFRPIRELVDGDSGLLVRDLKPIWLMSPLSVSDTLPLASQFVDVVIFDEASQVRLEDAVPTLFRGVQTIIVGDTMQLPPTNFFAQKTSDLIQPDDGGEVAESDETVADTDLSSDSLLRHAGKRLPSTMLGWHYRSRSESLISFSNWAFYEGKLLTVPDVSRVTSPAETTDRLAALTSPAETTVDLSNASPASTKPLVVRDTSQAYQLDDANLNEAELDQDSADSEPTAPPIVQPTAQWLSKPISFHFLENGCYEERRNQAEAIQVAKLVEQCLSDGSGRTVGVIAFSEAQQSEIERALEDRARESRDFAVLYERELNREEDGQFCGLLVKNLENIQGDERDVIILSVCYGPNPQKKISMNFGPINRDGGEKRLNVAFSRAKRHMAVVSSLRWGQITNDYNFGPSCLKQYLRYAECHSEHDRAGAELALAQLGRFRSGQQADAQQLDAVTLAITGALKSRGYEVDNLVGQSMFRVQAAVYLPGDATYRLGILVDTAENYATADPWERDVLRPRLLADFGWQIMRVLGKDWWKDSAQEMERIVERLAQ